MQRDENLVYINNGQQIDAIHMGYRQTGAVYTRLWDDSHTSFDVQKDDLHTGRGRVAA